MRTREEDLAIRRELEATLKERILVVDGATGTALESLKPTQSHFGGEEFFGCNEMLNLHAPHIVEQVHRGYIESGADIIETNSFNGSRIVMEEYDIPDKAAELVYLSTQIAHEAIKKHAGNKKVYVMGSMGPGTKSIYVTGGITFDEVKEVYREYAAALLKGDVDLLLLETVQDSLNLKAAIQGVLQAQEEMDRAVPLALSITIEASGTMLAGQNIEALYHTISNYDLFSIGLNCATGPALMTDHLRTLSKLSKFPVTVWPNAGLPDEDGNYSEGPQEFSNIISRFADEGFINIVGGCCGTTNEHIKVVAETIKNVKPRKPIIGGRFHALTGNESMVVADDNRPVFVGERTNTIGSRKFKRLVSEEKFDEAAEIGKNQVKKGAMVLDLCTANPDREEVPDFLNVLRPLLRKVRVPVMLDTTDPDVVKEAVKWIGGKPAINSVNLEDGGERLREIAAVAKEYNAALICGLIDDDPEQGMAISLERKLEIAEKIYAILVDEMDFPEEDIIYDPLVFPAGTGEPKYRGAALQTVEGVMKVRERFPNCLTILGISNVSFGLPNNGREVVNSVFLHECTKAGLDLAIVNTQNLKRFPSIPKQEIELSKRVLYDGDNSSIGKFVAHFRNVIESDTSDDDWEKLTIPERLSTAIIEARKTGLIDNLNELLKTKKPLDIINGPLLEGMKVVGKLFGENKLIVAEVLESAEIMKAAVDHLEPLMEKGENVGSKGKILIATVKGDVHDIGKNLVSMILANNGYTVVDLGIKIAPETILQAIKEHKPDILGLSGLLVRSTQQMVDTAKDLRHAGIKIPLIAGGAALTKKFTVKKIAPAYESPVIYATDAMNGLDICNQISDKNEKKKLFKEWKEYSNLALEKDDKQRKIALEEIDASWIECKVPVAPDYERHVVELDPKEVFHYTNPSMLYGKHLGIKGVTGKLKKGDDPKLNRLIKQVNEVFEEAVELGVIAPKGIYQWFPASSTNEKVIVDSEEKGQKEFLFPRATTKDRVSAVDWIRPEENGGDSINLFVVTAGKNITKTARKWQEEGRLLASHILEVLGLEIAEAAAELLHKQLRDDWGIPDPTNFTLQDLFRTRYHGIRLSFGYPACPDLEDQTRLFDLLDPGEIGVELTDGFMLYPESTVTAVVFHHPKGKYYVAETKS